VQGTAQRVVFNGRFLAQMQTGVQRYARETLLAFDALLADRAELRESLRCELALPPGTSAPPLRHIEPHKLPVLRGHAWEQLTLPLFARGAFLVNFSYSGPIAKRRQMITMHDATVAVAPSTFSKTYRVAHSLLLGLLKNRAQVLMTVSKFSRDEIARHFGITREIVVGHGGGEHAVVCGDGAGTVRRLGLEPGKYVLAVGSVKPNKNFALLGQALRLLEGFPWQIAVAGSRDASVFQSAEPPPGNVRMLGYVHDMELAFLYRHAAWFVLPSLYEGFGLPALEAMANGCPVLAARAASIPEVCGEAAVYFDPHDAASLAHALRRVVDEPALRRRVLEHAQRRLALYSWRANAEIVADQLLRVTASAQPVFA